MEALFTRLVGGGRLRERVLDAIREAGALGSIARIDVHVMAFSFTDDVIAGHLVELARARSNVTIRVIADWSQGSEGAGRLVRSLVELGLSNLMVRYKNDQPYVWDPVTRRIRWSYRASRGLLHHKTLAILVEGEPRLLVCGSFNWTSRASHSYENLLVFSGDDAASVDVMVAMEREFEAMWSDGRVTLSPEEVRARYFAILEEFRQHPDRPAGDIIGLARGADVPITALRVVARETTTSSVEALVAFSSRSPHQAEAEAGYSEDNRARRFVLHKPSGKAKGVPLTLTTLALDTIARAQAGDRLLVAMYGLSVRVPEYGALLEAARRGVRLQFVLDGHVSRGVLAQLATVTHREGLPIGLRAGAKTMHQKYLVLPEANIVLTGTANMSTDASRRHTEHRIVWRGDPLVTAAFVADFGAIWARLPSPFRSRTASESGASTPSRARRVDRR